MQTSSNAQALYDQITAAPEGPFSHLQKLVDAETAESEWVEFKGAIHLDTKPEETLNIWSKSLAAFANSSGGLLIWGINAPKKTANGVSLAKDATALANRLSETMNSVVQPHVPRVVITPILQGAGPEGFVVCLIPESRFAPHQSLLPQRQFYIRCQDNSIPTPYAALRRQFQPQQGPVLWVRSYLRVYKDGQGMGVSPEVRIKNAGYSTANDVVLQLSGHALFANHTPQWEGTGYGNMRAYTKPIHPDQTVSKTLNSDRIGGNDWPPDEANFIFNVKLYARDSRPFEYRFDVLWGTLRQQWETDQHKQVVVDGRLVEEDN